MFLGSCGYSDATLVRDKCVGKVRCIFVYIIAICRVKYVTAIAPHVFTHETQCIQERILVLLGDYARCTNSPKTTSSYYMYVYKVQHITKSNATINYSL